MLLQHLLGLLGATMGPVSRVSLFWSQNARQPVGIKEGEKKKRSRGGLNFKCVIEKRRPLQLTRGPFQIRSTGEKQRTNGLTHHTQHGEADSFKSPTLGRHSLPEWRQKRENEPMDARRRRSNWPKRRRQRWFSKSRCSTRNDWWGAGVCERRDLDSRRQNVEAARQVTPRKIGINSHKSA